MPVCWFCACFRSQWCFRVVNESGQVLLLLSLIAIGREIGQEVQVSSFVCGRVGYPCQSGAPDAFGRAFKLVVVFVLHRILLVCIGVMLLTAWIL